MVEALPLGEVPTLIGPRKNTAIDAGNGGPDGGPAGLTALARSAIAMLPFRVA